MLRAKKDWTYEIDWELTGQLAIKSNAELQEENEKLKKKLRRLEKDHKHLQVEHCRVLFDMDAVIEHEVNVKCKKLKKENKELKAIIEHYKRYEEWMQKLHRFSDFWWYDE